MREYWELFWKGIPIGISNTLPGVSGGTMALVLNIYVKLIEGIKGIKLKVLIPIFLGAVSGVFLSSYLITGLLDTHPEFMISVLFGLILASSKVTFDEVNKFTVLNLILVLAGFILAFFYSQEARATDPATGITLFNYFSGGALGSMAMILPGISGGTILVLMGVYRGILTAISNFDLMILLVFGLGLALGLLFFSWFLSYFINHFRSKIMALLTGLILGSLRSVIPSSIGISVVTGVIIGILIIFGLIWLQKVV
ncbi:MAG: DUF368 domain-containing protein [Halanaerobiales bacterium]